MINHKDNYKTIMLMGHTGTGKTTLISKVFSDIIVEKPIKKILNCNKETPFKTVIFTDNKEFSESMGVVLEHKSQLYEKEDFYCEVKKCIFKYFHKYGKSGIVSEENVGIFLKEEFINEVTCINGGNNIISLLHESFIQEISSKLADVILHETSEMDPMFVYNSAKNSLNKRDDKNNSNKFQLALEKEVEEYLDTLGSSFKNSIDEIHEEVESKLHNILNYVLFKVNAHKLNGDRESYFKIDLNDTNALSELMTNVWPLKEWTSNVELTMEVLFKNITLYVPLNRTLKEKIDKHEKVRRYLSDSYGNISFSVVDTMGLFHESLSQKETQEYFNDILYTKNYDVLMVCAPICEEKYWSSTKELLVNALSNYNKSTPIFLLNSKVDTMIDNEVKMDYREEVPSLKWNSMDHINSKEIINEIESSMKKLSSQLVKGRGPKKRPLNIFPISYYIKKGNSMTEELCYTYDPFKCIERAMFIIGEISVPKDEGLEVKLNKDSSHLEVKVDKEELEEILKKHFKDKATEKSVFNPSVLNINENLGANPNKYFYKEFLKRLSQGVGYSSFLNEEYYNEGDSINITFPGNIKNLITDELLKDIIENCISFEGGKFLKEDYKADLYELIIKNNYFDKFKFVNELLYHNALKEINNKKLFSTRRKFNEILKIHLKYILCSVENGGKYCDIIEGIVTNAVEKTVNLNYDIRINA